MSDETSNLILSHLRAMRSDIHDMKEGQREIRGRLANLEASYANLSARVDRMDDRIARIETRLELTDQ